MVSKSNTRSSSSSSTDKPSKKSSKKGKKEGKDKKEKVEYKHRKRSPEKFVHFIKTDDGLVKQEANVSFITNIEYVEQDNLVKRCSCRNQISVYIPKCKLYKAYADGEKMDRIKKSGKNQFSKECTKFFSKAIIQKWKEFEGREHYWIVEKGDNIYVSKKISGEIRESQKSIEGATVYNKENDINECYSDGFLQLLKKEFINSPIDQALNVQVHEQVTSYQQMLSVKDATKILEILGKYQTKIMQNQTKHVQQIISIPEAQQPSKSQVEDEAFDLVLDEDKNMDFFNHDKDSSPEQQSMEEQSDLQVEDEALDSVLDEENNNMNFFNQGNEEFSFDGSPCMKDFDVFD